VFQHFHHFFLFFLKDCVQYFRLFININSCCSFHFSFEVFQDQKHKHNFIFFFFSFFQTPLKKNDNKNNRRNKRRFYFIHTLCFLTFCFWFLKTTQLISVINTILTKPQFENKEWCLTTCETFSSLLKDNSFFSGFSFSCCVRFCYFCFFHRNSLISFEFTCLSFVSNYSISSKW